MTLILSTVRSDLRSAIVPENELLELVTDAEHEHNTTTKKKQMRWMMKPKSKSVAS